MKHHRAIKKCPAEAGPGRRRWLLSALLAAALLAGLPVQGSAADGWDAIDEPAPGVETWGGGSVESTETPSTASLTLIRTNEHEKYMDGYADGMFRPDDPVSRAELAQMLVRIVAGTAPVTAGFSDVPQDSWFAPAVERAAGLGLMVGEYGAFRPDDPATRAECAYALAQLLPDDAPLVDAFPDVAPWNWAYQAICRTAGQGLFYGDDRGNFRPYDSLSRCEAAAVFNRMLGRSPDLRVLAARSDLRVFPDVPRSHWAYGEVMEAAVSHVSVPGGGGQETWGAVDAERTALADGLYVMNGLVYRVRDGMFLNSTSDGYLTYDADGRAAFTHGPVQLILQKPELPNGCEATSLAMVLGSTGYPVDKMTLYRDYLPTAEVSYQGGRRYGPDPEESYAGNAASQSGGWYCFEGPVVRAANGWLADSGSDLQALSISGLSQDELDAYAKAGIPVVAWVTINYAAPKLSSSSWRLADGTLYRPYTNLHCVVLTGISNGRYQIADPLHGLSTVSRSTFWSSFSAMGSRAVVVA